jgi:putative endopeptidase
MPKFSQFLISVASAALLAGAAHAAVPGLPSGLDVAGVDKAVKPGDDFFAYANGAWDKTAEIPADRSSYGLGAQMVEITDKRVADIIQNLGKGGQPLTAEQKKIADYYAAYMDEAAIEARGLKPIEGELKAIEAIKTRKDLAKALGRTLRADVDVLNATNYYTQNLFGLWVAADLDHPKRYAAFLLQGGLGMPDRDYYLTASPRMDAIRTRYQAHIATLLKLAGVADAEARAAKVYALELAIAKGQESLEDSEDVQKGDNHWTRADFAQKAPGLDWNAYFAAAGLGHQQTFVAWQPGAISAEAALVSSTPIEVWKDYLAYQRLNRWSGLLPKAYSDERFEFYSKTLSGIPQQQARWKRAVTATNGALGDAVGKLYAAEYFPPEAKAGVQQLVKNLIAAFDMRIDQLDWMSPATKVTAKAKLRALKVGVGYPDKWLSYGALKVDAHDALGNAMRSSDLAYHRELAKLAKPVDRDEWFMSPQTVNAVNLPVLNALNFPAAELQPPHFDPKQPAALNYGSVGAIIGHEISHSFDSTGALFDDQGRLRNWWTDADFAHFKAATAALARQFDTYKPFPDLAVRGQQTLGEDIADLAGLQASLDAYHLSLGGKPAPVVDGYTGDQQFFLAFAQSWRAKFREAALRQRILTDVHAPAQYRAETVRNLDAWYSAFDVKPGEGLYLAPAERVRIW